MYACVRSNISMCRLIMTIMELNNVSIHSSQQRASNSSLRNPKTPPWRQAHAYRQYSRPQVAAPAHDTSPIKYQHLEHIMYRRDCRAHRTSYVVVMGIQPFDAMLELCATYDTIEFTKSAKSLHWAHQNCKQSYAAATMSPDHCSPPLGTLARALERSHWILPIKSFPSSLVLPHAPLLDRRPAIQTIDSRNIVAPFRRLQLTDSHCR